MNKKSSVEKLRDDFWTAPDASLFNRVAIAAALDLSVAWMDLKATAGGGIPFLKIGRRCLYRKSDVLAWLEQNGRLVHSTSEYTNECSK